MTNALCVIILAFLANVAYGAKKLPSGMSQHQYCHGCMATMKELARKLPKNLKGSRDVAVVDALEKICTPSNFVSYKYSPPKTVKACKLLLENHEDEIEESLMKKENIDTINTLICNEISEACKGIDLDNESEDAKYSDIDLTKNDDGSSSVQVDPTTGKVVKEAKEKKNDGKTLSKKSKKKKDKKQKKQKGETGKSTKKSKDSEPTPGGKQKGAIHNLNIDINDPDSVKRVMAEINKISGKYNSESNKDEL